MNRVHPGGSSLIFTVVPEAELQAAVDTLRRARDEARTASATRIWAFGADEVA